MHGETSSLRANPASQVSMTHCFLSPRIQQLFAKTCQPLSASSSARTTITTRTIVTAGSRGRAFINAIINLFRRNNVAVSIRPDTVAAVLTLFKRMFGATFASIGHAWSFVQWEQRLLFNWDWCECLKPMIRKPFFNMVLYTTAHRNEYQFELIQRLLTISSGKEYLWWYVCLSNDWCPIFSSLRKNPERHYRGSKIRTVDTKDTVNYWQCFDEYWLFCAPHIWAVEVTLHPSAILRRARNPMRTAN